MISGYRLIPAVAARIAQMARAQADLVDTQGSSDRVG
jgi:hypothetical protein